MLSREEAKEIIDACWGKICYEVIPKCSELSRGVFSSCPYNGGYGIDRCSAHNCNAYIKRFRFNENSTVAGFGETWFDYKPDAQAVVDKLNNTRGDAK